MSRETKVPSIPSPSDGNLVQALQAIKSGLDVREGRLGDPLDQFVSLRDLNALGIVTTSGSTTLTTVGGSGTLPVVPIIGSGFGPTTYNGSTDLTTPGAPTGLTATATLTNVYLSWNAATYSNHAYTEIWRSNTNVLGNAVLVGTSIGSLYQDPVRENTTYYYWIRFVSVANVISPYNSTNGTQVTTGQDPTRLLQILTGQITESQLYNTLGARINLIDGPTTLAGSVAARVYAEELARIAADTSLGSSITTLQNSDATQATQITSLTTRTTAAESSIVTLQNTTATQATTISSLNTRVGSAESNITNLQTTTASQATSISTLNSTVSGNSTSISTLTSTTNGLSAQYTVKVDSNGYVSGFGLASTAINGTPTSSFIIRADSFSIASPSGPGISPSIPFIVRTTPTTINGESVPAGVYISSAWIQNGTLNSAQIVSLTADKITAGTITAAVDLQSPIVRSGTVAPGNAGFYLGNYGGVNQFYIGNGSTGVDGRSLRFTGTDVEVRGTIYAYAGLIGGGLSTSTTGYIYGGKPSASSTTAGYFLGYDSGAYQFSIGNSTNSLRWNGSSLSITGDISGTSNIDITGSATFRGSTLYGGNYYALYADGASSISGAIGRSSSGIGITGISTSNYGVYGTSVSGSGVYGSSSGGSDTWGVYGNGMANAAGGVYGYGNSGVGVKGYSNNTGVLGLSNGSYGGFFQTSSSDSTAAGVGAVNYGAGPGLKAISSSSTAAAFQGAAGQPTIVLVSLGSVPTALVSGGIANVGGTLYFCNGSTWQALAYQASGGGGA